MLLRRSGRLSRPHQVAAAACSDANTLTCFARVTGPIPAGRRRWKERSEAAISLRRPLLKQPALLIDSLYAMLAENPS